MKTASFLINLPNCVTILKSCLKTRCNILCVFSVENQQDFFDLMIIILFLKIKRKKMYFGA